MPLICQANINVLVHFSLVTIFKMDFRRTLRAKNIRLITISILYLAWKIGNSNVVLQINATDG